MLTYESKSLDDLFCAIRDSNNANNREDRIELSVLDNSGQPYYELSVLSKDDDTLSKGTGNNLDYLVSNVFGEFLINIELLKVEAVAENCVTEVVKKNKQLNQEDTSEILDLTKDLLSVGYFNKEYPTLSSHRDLEGFLYSVRGVVMDTINNSTLEKVD